MTELIPEALFLYGEYDLHTPLKVSRHPVRASAVNLALSAVFKVKDTAVFKEGSDNGANRYILTHPGYSHLKTAYTADYKVYLYTLAARRIESRDNIGIAE